MSRKRVLVLNSHEAWISQLDGLPLDLDIVVGLAGRNHSGWDTRMRPQPAGSRVITLRELSVESVQYQVAIAHNISDLLEIRSLDIPKILVIHTTLEGRLREEDGTLSAQQVSNETKKYLKLIRCHVVAVSELKRRSWGIPADVVGFSIRPSDYPVATQERARGLRISNLFNLRRGILMADFHEEAFGGLPFEFVGVNDDMPGVSPANDWADLKKRMGSSRFYVHTADPRLEDGYNMATAEAMASGLAVLGNCHPTSAIEHGVSGFMSNDPSELRQYAQLLLNDRELSLRMGAAARVRAHEFFARDKFEKGVLSAITTAKGLYWEHNKVVRKKKTVKRKKRVRA